MGSDDAGGPLSRLASLHRRARFTRWLGRSLVVAVAFFFASAFAGYAVVDAIPLDQLQGLVPDRSVLPEFSATAIALNNLRVLVLVAAGLVTLGVVAVLVLCVNGLVVGAVVALSVPQASWPVVLAALVPHGVLELSAFWVGAAVTLRFSSRLLRWVLGYDESPLTRVEAYELVTIYTVLVVAIVVAAWIEVTITPEVMRLVGGPDAL